MRPCCCAAALFLGGCHILLPYAPGSDGAGDRQASDGQTSDRRADAPFAGDGPRDARRLEQAADRGCVLDQLMASGCGGLPAYRAVGLSCADLLYEERFSSDPSGRWEFRPQPATDWSYACGAMSQTNPSVCDHRWGVARNATSVSSTTDYLVEGGITLGPQSCVYRGADAWSVGIASRVAWTPGQSAPTAYVICQAWRNAELKPAVLLPDVGLTYNGGAGETGSWGPENPSTYDASPAKRYYLQVWYSTHGPPDNTRPNAKALVCRICDDTSCPRFGWANVEDNPYLLNYIPKTGGTVGIRTYGRAASFDYVRVYKLNNP